MFNLERLRMLQAVSRHGSVSAAADGLHVTTSAVSQQLAKLEREAGQTLLARNGRGVRLTDAGRLLAGHADLILSQVERARAELEERRGQAVGRLVLGAFPTAARGLLARACGLLRAGHPQLEVSLRECEPDDCGAGLARGDLDIGVVLDWYNKPLALPEGLVRRPLLDDVVDIAVPTGHPLAGRDSVELEELAPDSWISGPEGGFCNDWLMFTLRSKGIEPRIAHHAAEYPTHLALVAAGLGVAVVPRLGRGPVPGDVRLLPVRHVMHRHVYAVWREDADRRPSVRAAVDALARAAQTASASGQTVSGQTVSG